MIKKQLTKNYNFVKKMFYYIFAILIAIFFLFSYLNYVQNKNNFYENIDKLLKSSAKGIESVLEKDFHNRALNKESISKKEDKINIQNLTQYANFMEIQYVYTMIKIEDKIYFTSSSATYEDFEKEQLTHYFDEYKSASQLLKNSFTTKKIVYEESIDKWGEFRSVFIPMTTSEGHVYVLGADIKMNYIQSSLNKIIFNNIILFSLTMLIIIILFLYKRRLEIQEVVTIDNIENELRKEIELKTEELRQLNLFLEEKVNFETKKNSQQNKLLLQSSKSAAMGEMIDVIIHQWKQPINVISIELGMMKKSIDMGISNVDILVDSIDLSRKQIIHLNNTINQFRQFFSQNQDFKEINILELINNSLSLLKPIIRIKEIDINVNCDEDISYKVIEAEFIHIFINIINNSIDAFEENDIEDRKIKIDVKKQNSNLTIKIKDNAGGIPLNIMDDIFKANFTTKIDGNGSGIGLYITQQIINKIDGTIKVENIYENSQKGALFTIKL